jgi:hypothetical protein
VFGERKPRFFSIEKWSNSARFHALGCIARFRRRRWRFLIVVGQKARVHRPLKGYYCWSMDFSASQRFVVLFRAETSAGMASRVNSSLPRTSSRLAAQPFAGCLSDGESKHGLMVEGSDRERHSGGCECLERHHSGERATTSFLTSRSGQTQPDLTQSGVLPGFLPALPSTYRLNTDS